MLAVDFKAALGRLKLSQRAFAAKVGYSEEQICRYARGKKPVPRHIALLVSTLLANETADNAH